MRISPITYNRRYNRQYKPFKKVHECVYFSLLMRLSHEPNFLKLFLKYLKDEAPPMYWARCAYLPMFHEMSNYYVMSAKKENFISYYQLPLSKKNPKEPRKNVDKKPQTTRPK